jgi:starch phosphorylase
MSDRKIPLQNPPMITQIEIERSTAARARELPPNLQPLERLAWNYWWSWAPDGTETFRDLDDDVWEQCEHNPRALLALASDLRIAERAADPSYAERVRQLAARFDAYMNDARPSPNLHLSGSITAAAPVAYFCAEYGIHSSLPLYSGGLGILAGDHLKSASDLNLPLVAVGLFYRFGYFHQSLRSDGWQEESYRETDAGTLPLRSVNDGEGRPLRIEVTMRGRPVRARAWRADIGRVRLYLLDTNVAENEETDRLVTGHLYGGDRETRMVQEKMLGIGGARLLRRLSIEPGVFHLNEGHSAFLTLELARELIESDRVDFAVAASRVRERCVFTTHTPVAAGHDEFSAELIDKGFGSWYETALGLSREQFLALGRVNGDSREGFGLTPLALRMCRSTNGVSRKHGEVSRELWQRMWPERSVSDVPITSVTNGVHAATWAAPMIRALYEKYVGADWNEKTCDAAAWSSGIARISDPELWQAHCLLKERLMASLRHRSIEARAASGDGVNVLDSKNLTIGFARRVAGYKRWDLLLRDPERLLRLINSAERPVQFVFAGKAHPQDQEAKLVLQKLAKWQHDWTAGNRLTFFEDYDQEIARLLVQGVDVWMNVPRRPQEASGTSGQKAAVNGGLNFSVLDGWWLEGYDGDNGFAIGDLSELTDDEADATDAESMYRTLEEEIVPRFYERDHEDLPRRWLSLMKRSIETLVPVFNSDRMVAEYANRIYQRESN